MVGEHTPGPWKPEFKPHGSGTQRIVRRATGKGYGVAHVIGDPGPPERKDADAHLIAASPALKRNLLMALAWYYDQRYDGTTEPMWVHEALETLGEILRPGKDARTKHEAVEVAIREADL